MFVADVVMMTSNLNAFACTAWFKDVRLFN